MCKPKDKKRKERTQDGGWGTMVARWSGGEMKPNLASNSRGEFLQVALHIY